MKTLTSKIIRCLFGLFLFAIGSFLSIQANVGLSPWGSFNMGLSYVTGLSYGNILISTGIVFLLISWFLKEKIGLGTLMDTFITGKFVDLFRHLDIIPSMNHWTSGIPLLILGQVLICVGSYYYISSGLGCGPRDALMVALGKRLSQLPIGLVRGVMEGTVLLIGWMLGAKVGVGTVIAVFGIGFILQYTFQFFKFEVKEVQHEDLIQTLKKIKALVHKPQP